MKLTSIVHLYRVRLNARIVLGQELFALGGIAVGIALLFASQIASESVNGSVRQLTSDVVGNMQLQLEARGSQGFDQRLAVEAHQIPNVRSVLPVLEASANVVGPIGQRGVDLIGTEPRAALHGTPLLRRFSNEQLAKLRAVALPAPILQATGAESPGSVTLQIGAKDIRVLVGTELTARTVGALIHSPVVLAPLVYAQTLADMPGRISRLFVRTTPGAEREVKVRLRQIATAHGLNLEPADYDARLFQIAAAPANQGESLFAGISALVGFMFAINAMLLTLNLRRRLIRGLRSDGATRLTTVKALLFDALVLGGLAVALGLALGDLLSIAVFRSNPGYLSFAFPLGSQRIVAWQSIAIAVGAGFLAACVGVLMPLPELWSGSIAAFKRRERRGHSRWTAGSLAVGTACLVATTIILLAAPQAAVLGSVILVVALLLLLPLLLDTFVAVCSSLRGPFETAATRVAVSELRAPAARTRSVAIAATGAIAVFGSVAIQGAHANLQRGLDRLFHEVTTVSDVWVAPPGPQNLLATAPFSGDVQTRLARLPGVQTVGLYRATFMNYRDRRAWVLAPPRTVSNPIPPNQLVAGNLALARTRLRAGGWAVVSQAIAAEHHLAIGELFTLPASRPITLRVAALITNLGWPPGAIILNPADYVRAWDSPDPSAYSIRLRPGATPQQGSREVQRALGTRSALVVQTARQRQALQETASRQGLSRLTQIATLVLVATVLAMSIAMGTMIWQRRPRLARMKVEGYETGVLWRALLLESGLLLGTGCSIGAAFGIYGQVLISHALATVTGFPVIFSTGAFTAIASFALVTAVAVAIIAVPGHRAASVPGYV
jgi:putative ABC transport system permease protein